ncbi:MAG TPA: hypothetical protein VIR00_08020 [Micromonosporaceae bacterium]
MDLLAVVEARDEAAARRLMADGPVVAKEIRRGELRPYRVSLLRGWD